MHMVKTHVNPQSVVPHRRAGTRPLSRLLALTAPALHLPRAASNRSRSSSGRKSRVDAIEHARVLVAHGWRAELVGDAIRAQPGGVGGRRCLEDIDSTL